jgi:hypothetical protein
MLQVKLLLLYVHAVFILAAVHSSVMSHSTRDRYDPRWHDELRVLTVTRECRQGPTQGPPHMSPEASIYKAPKVERCHNESSFARCCVLD